MATKDLAKEEQEFPAKDEGEKIQTSEKTSACTTEEKTNVIYKFCDIQPKLVKAWEEYFCDYIPKRVTVHQGDIFKQGPAADAIVSPANSFGFMDGGIDMVYSKHFGWQMQERLQKVIREKHHGEVLVGEAVIIPSMDKLFKNTVNWSAFNGGQPIKYLISAPTMRVPADVDNTANAYLAFRAVILTVDKWNATPGNEPIRSVLCPGLGTAVGRMSAAKCAHQMFRAFEIFEIGLHPETLCPGELYEAMEEHLTLLEVGREKELVQKKKIKSSTVRYAANKFEEPKGKSEEHTNVDKKEV